MQRALLFALAMLAAPACLLQRVPSDSRVLPPAQENPGDLARALRAHVEKLSVDIGQRSYQTPRKLDLAANYVEAGFRKTERQGLSRVRVWPFRVEKLPCYFCWAPRCGPEFATRGETGRNIGAVDFRNIDLAITGATLPREVIVVGAHYDSDSCLSGGCNPGADDNASGTAALLELARLLQDKPMARTVRLVAFTNEEEPFFHEDSMGSLVYARQTQNPGEKVLAMFSVETIGYFSDEPKSQDTPLLLGTLYGLPTVGNFIAFVGDWGSSSLVHESVKRFRQAADFPAEGVVSSPWIPGIDWSDHWSYWQVGVPAVMVTDTAPNRNKCYHKRCDTAGRLDYDRMARVVIGLRGVIEAMAK